MGKRLFASFASMLLLLAGLSCTAFAFGADREIGLGDADVTCEVPPTYDFSAPADAVIQYPQTYRYLGAFGIGDILLRSGETLNVVVTMGSLVKTGPGGGVLPYTVIFNAPSDFDGAFAGTSYDVTIEIDDADFRSASTGTYAGYLLFQVESSHDSQVVWQRKVLISAVRTSPAGTSEPQTVETGPDETALPVEGEDDQTETPPADGQPAQPPEAAADTDSGDAQGIPVGMEESGVLSAAEIFAQYWFLIPAVLGAALIAVLLVILLKKRKRNER